MYLEIKHKFRKALPRIYTCLCLCFNKFAYEKEMIRHEILEENDLLREEFFKSIGNLKKMYKDGRIVLNKNTLERLSLYLNEERIL